MKISEAQIESLYSFTRQHFVEWYDLQTELVDHLANAIEAQWQENPTLSFDEALQKEFKKFGIFGFMDVVEQRQVALNKKYNKIVWKHFREFFGLPKILLSVGFMAILFLSMKQISYPEIPMYALILFVLGMFLTQVVRQIRYQNRKTKKDEKRWLFQEVIRSYGNMSILLMLPFQALGRMVDASDKLVQNDILLTIFCVLSVSFCIADYVILFVIPSKAETYLTQTYPEYRLENV